jgi:hemin uptake protein HemP
MRIVIICFDYRSRESTMLEHRPSRPIGSVTTAPSLSADEVSTRRAGATRVDSRRLLEGGRELVIDHAGVEYRLRLTRNDKLILTK